MSDTVNLVNPRKRHRDSDKDINLCFFCKKVKRPLQLCSSEKGIKNIKSASQHIGDDVFKNIEDENSIKYHITCYRPYILKGKRAKEKQEKGDEESSSEEEDNIAQHQRQRQKSTAGPSGQLKKCVVCNQLKVKGDSKLYRICEKFRAEQLLKASRFYLDAVFQRTGTLEDVNSVFAADVHSHKNCIRKYILNYQRDIKKDVDEDTAGFENLQESFTEFAATLQFDTKGYSIAYLRNEFSEKYLSSELQISNRRMKSLLIEQFGDTISFTYSKNRSVSQMVFSNQITAVQLAEEIRSSDCIKGCAETLRSDIKSYDFGLKNTDCNAKDLFKSFTEAKDNLPQSWLKFCSVMFPGNHTSP